VRVAIVHYWLVRMRGGEQVLERCAIWYPQADIFTHVVAVDSILREAAPAPYQDELHRKTAAGALLVQEILAADADRASSNSTCAATISSSAASLAPAKGIVPPPIACTSAMSILRCANIWNMYADYRASAGLMFPSQHAGFFKLLANVG